MTRNKILAVNPVNPESDIIFKAGKIIQNNGLVIFPAKYLYGIATNALNKKAVKKVFHLKQRPLNNPILILIPDRDMLPYLVKSILEPAKKLMDTFWPGNLTLVFEAKDTIPQILTANTGKIGVRIPAHPVANALVKHAGFPITGTSANLSGQQSCSRINQLDPAIIDHADLVLDAGSLQGGAGSTIADATSSKITIIREGAVSKKKITRTLSL
ncbi:MAG: threonylcarbamoyl-AMP synthase [Deltaproteobacteria bacterium]|nr:threonylcarbamoyl-AMP synthase [Deltaproteobacteria bacterium]